MKVSTKQRRRYEFYVSNLFYRKMFAESTRWSFFIFSIVFKNDKVVLMLSRFKCTHFYFLFSKKFWLLPWLRNRNSFDEFGYCVYVWKNRRPISLLFTFCRSLWAESRPLWLKRPNFKWQLLLLMRFCNTVKSCSAWVIDLFTYTCSCPFTLEDQFDVIYIDVIWLYKIAAYLNKEVAMID